MRKEEKNRRHFKVVKIMLLVTSIGLWYIKKNACTSVGCQFVFNSYKAETKLD